MLGTCSTEGAGNKDLEEKRHQTRRKQTAKDGGALFEETRSARRDPAGVKARGGAEPHRAPVPGRESGLG